LKRATLAAVGVGVALALCELGLRLWVAGSITAPPTALSFDVHADSLFDFDGQLGYRYRPGMGVLSVRFRDGHPTRYWFSRTNPDGNVGAPSAADGWHEGAFRITVLGDSFTANPNYGGTTWTDYLSDELGAGLGRPVAVRNLGRDGYGLLQMLDLAAATLEPGSADLILVAYITNDLARNRFWRFTTTIDGDTRLFSSLRPAPELDWAVCTDALFLDARITEPWVQALLRRPDPDDPLVASISQRFLELRDQNLRMRRRQLWSPFRSLLFDRLVVGDPLIAAPQRTRLPTMGSSSFEDDPAFVRKLGRLTGLGTPVVFLRLPQFREIKHGDYDPNRQQRALQDSLESLLSDASGVHFVRVIDFMEPANTATAQMFHFPVDYHPNQRGARTYAAAIATALRGLFADTAAAAEK